MKRAEALRENTSSGNQAENQSVFARFVRSRPWAQKLSAAYSTFEKYSGPVGAAMRWIGNSIGKWFQWAAYPSQSTADVTNQNEPRISPKRLLVTLPATIATLLTLHVAWSALYYYSTGFKETVYVTGKQEIETGELYQFGGCIS